MADINNTASGVPISGNDTAEKITNSGDNVTISGGGGNDTITNYGSSVTVIASSGNNKIYNTRNTATYPAENVFIQTGDGNDSIQNSGEGATIDAGDGKNDIFIWETGKNSSVKSGSGDDTVGNYAEKTFIDAGDGENEIENHGENSTILGGKDDDTIRNSGNKTSIVAGDASTAYGNNITNSGDEVTISGGAGVDVIDNSGYKTSIDAGDGDNTVFNSSYYATYEHRAGEAVTIKTGTGNDFISSDGSDVLIDAGDGNNTVENVRYDDQGNLTAAGNATIKTGAGNDSVINTGTQSSVVTGDGADTVDNSGFSTHVETGDGNDYVLSHGDNSTIETGAGNDTIFNHANLNAVSSTTVHAGDGDNYVYTDGGQDFITAGDGNDTIESHAYSVSIESGNGNDSVNNTGANTTIKTGAGNDIVNNKSGNESHGNGQACFIDTGDGNDTITNETMFTTIVGGNGNDSIVNGFGGSNASILAGAGNDTIIENTDGNTIDAGDGDDYIQINSKASGDVITLGDGADTIHFDSKAVRTKLQVNGFGADDQIQLDNAVNSISINQFHALVAGLVTIGGITQVSTEKNSWRIENGVAIYSAQTTAGAVLSADGKTITWTDGSTQDLIRINGLKDGLTVNADGSIDGLTLSGNKVTVTKDVLGTSEVTINDGYEFKFAPNVPHSQTTAEHWSVSNNAGDGTTSGTSTATYQAGGTTEGYRLVDGNKIVYSAATGGDTFTLTGLAPNLQINADATAIEGITVTADNIIKLSADLLCKSDVTLNNPAYHIDPVNYFPPVNVLNEYWTVDGTNKTATYHSSGTSEGYTYTDQKITYHPATNDKSSVTVTGIAEGVTAVNGVIDGLYFGGKAFVVAPNVMGENFAIPTGYEITFMPGDYAGKMYNGSTDSDTIEIHGDNLKVDGGDGDDIIISEGNSVTIEGGAGNDSVQNSGAQALIETGDGSDTVENNADAATIESGDGDDQINNYADNVLIDPGSSATENGNYVYNTGNNVTVKTANTTIVNDGGYIVSYDIVDGDFGNADGDTDTAANSNTIVNANGQNFVIDYMGGTFFVEGFNETSTLNLGGGGTTPYTATKNGSDIIVNAGNGSITLKDAANLSAVNIIGLDTGATGNVINGSSGKDNLTNDKDDMIINALEDNDTVTNTGDRVTINGDGGDDSISNEGTDGTINGGDGADEISNYGENTTIYGGHGKDSVYNTGNKIFALDDEGDDYFHNMGDGVTISAGDGNDIIDNLEGDDVYLSGGQGNDSIRNVGARATLYGIYGDNTLESYNSERVSIVGGDGNDLIINLNGEFATIEGGFGDDSVVNSGNNTKVNTGFGDDSILNSGENVTIDAGEGYDIVDNYASNVTINSGAGNDLINNMVADTKNRMTNVKIDGGDDDDVINSNGNSVTIDGGAGNDILRNFGGQIVVMNGGDGDDHLVNNVLTKRVTMNGGNGDDTIENDSDYVTIGAGAGNDSIKNTGKANIDLGAGDDTVENEGAFGTIAGTGNNVIKNFGEHYKINLGDGNDVITNDALAQYAKIDAGDGNNRIENAAVVATVKTGAGNDYIKNTAESEVTITTGAGSDTVELGANVAVVTVTDFGKGDEIWLPAQASSLTFNGYGIDVNGVTAPVIEIDGINQVATVNYSWRIENGKAIYSKQTSAGAVLSGGGMKIIWSDTAQSEEMFTISGLKSGLTVNADGTIDGLKINGNKITVSQSVLSTTEVSVNNGYELVLDTDVPVSTLVPETWTVTADTGNTSKVTYTGEHTSLGYKIIDGKIKHFTGTTGDSFIIRGLAPNLNCNGASVEGITLNDKEITLSASVLIANGNKASLTGKGYTLALGDDCQKPVAVGQYWNVDVTDGIYMLGGKSGGFVLNTNKTIVSYSAPTKSTPLFSIGPLVDYVTKKDLEANATVNGNVVTVNPGIVGNNFTIKENYAIEFAAGDYTGKNFVGFGTSKDTVKNHGDNLFINGENGDDSIYTEGRGVTIEGGHGNDKITSGTTSGNVYRYATGDGYDTIWGYNKHDTIQITDATTVGVSNFTVKNGNIVITIGKGSIILENAAINGQELTFIDPKGLSLGGYVYQNGMFVQNKTAYLPKNPIEKIFSTSPKNINFGIGNHDVADGEFGNADSDDDSEVEIQHIDGALAKNSVKLIGDEGDNSLIGGAGSDTIQSGGGEDTFVGGKGNDLFIHDGGDVTIADYEAGDKISLGTALDGFTVNGTDIVLSNLSGSITVSDAVGKKITLAENGKSSTGIFTYDGKTNGAKTSIQLASSTQSFAADSKLVTIDGGLTSNATITGNAKSNKIFGGDGDDVLIGMGGNDTLYGGSGEDIFIHDSGKDVILDFNADEDKIVLGTGKVSSSSVNSKGDVVLKVGTGSVTVKKLDDEEISDGKTITISDDDGENSYTYFSEKIVSDDGKVTLNSNFKGSSFTADENIYEVDASAVAKKFAITGNDEDNTLIGGKGANFIDGGAGDDVLIGGAGNDTFVVSAGDDTIGDYGNGTDKISLGSAQIKNYSVDDGDVIFSFDGSNSLTIQDAAGEKITLVENGKSVVNVYAADGIFNTAKTAVTLAANTPIFSAANYSKLTTINGSAVTGEVEILGNGKANKIYAGDFDSTLNGGNGNDTLWGGDGSDTFIYNPGGGKDVIYDFGAEDMLQIGADFTASLKNNSVAFTVGTTANAITLKDFSGTEFVANGDTYQLNGSKFVKK